MENTRIAIIGIIVSDLNSAEKVNALLHEYADIIIGRMGIPHRAKGVSIISVAVDGNVNVINALTGKLGMIENVSSKALWR
ncbi:MAG: iron-only hydrogenase system regulator [Clostridia bacterium]|nr:iron-only hydrogenase system regulator [Clostridia bacterium]